MYTPNRPRRPFLSPYQPPVGFSAERPHASTLPSGAAFWYRRTWYSSMDTTSRGKAPAKGSGGGRGGSGRQGPSRRHGHGRRLSRPRDADGGGRGPVPAPRSRLVSRFPALTSRPPEAAVAPPWRGFGRSPRSPCPGLATVSACCRRSTASERPTSTWSVVNRPCSSRRMYRYEFALSWHGASILWALPSSASHRFERPPRVRHGVASRLRASSAGRFRARCRRRDRARWRPRTGGVGPAWPGSGDWR